MNRADSADSDEDAASSTSEESLAAEPDRFVYSRDALMTRMLGATGIAARWKVVIDVARELKVPSRDIDFVKPTGKYATDESLATLIDAVVTHDLNRRRPVRADPLGRARTRENPNGRKPAGKGDAESAPGAAESAPVDGDALDASPETARNGETHRALPESADVYETDAQGTPRVASPTKVPAQKKRAKAQHSPSGGVIKRRVGKLAKLAKLAKFTRFLALAVPSLRQSRLTAAPLPVQEDEQMDELNEPEDAPVQPAAPEPAAPVGDAFTV
jgi:hypothetical protein